jgi:hypothetical protein
MKSPLQKNEKMGRVTHEHFEMFFHKEKKFDLEISFKRNEKEKPVLRKIDGAYTSNKGAVTSLSIKSFPLEGIRRNVRAHFYRKYQGNNS